MVETVDARSWLLTQVIRPALGLLDQSLRTRPAEAMLLAIALQESGIRDRVQRQAGVREWWQSEGPARGWWQFERDGGVAGVLRLSKTRLVVAPVLDLLRYPPQPAIIHDALAHNDTLACVMARALLVSVPQPLPGPAAPGEAWRQYLWAWRPGKPHPATWDGFYAAAWAAVNGN